MPTILSIPWSDTDTAEVKLMKADLAVDPRVILWDEELDERQTHTFECTIKGRNLTVRRMDRNAGWFILYCRIYDPSVESVPEFTSKSYTYHGLDDEYAPSNVEEIIIDPSVEVIKEEAFMNCRRMKRCFMHDNVVSIEGSAFDNCLSLMSIRLSKGLRFIGNGAFWSCPFRGLFIPPNVEYIDTWAFYDCDEMKILVLPPNITIQCFGHDLFQGCVDLLNDLKIQYQYDSNDEYRRITINDDQINYWVKHRYDRSPLIRLCADPDVTAKTIRNFVEECGTTAFYLTDDRNHYVTPLHILTHINACYVADDAIIACYDANPEVLFSPDATGLTPLDYLWEHSKVNVIMHLMQDLCINRYNDMNHEILCGNGRRKRNRDD